MNKNTFLFLAKLCVSFGLVAYLVTLIDWNRALKVGQMADKWLWLLVLLIILGGFLFSSWRWRLVLANNGVRFPAWQAYRGYLLGLFYGIFLPGVLGGDAVRVGLCMQHTKCQIGTATAAVLLERISGVVSLFCILFGVNLISPVIASTLLTIKDTGLIMALAVVGMLGIAVVLLGRVVWLKWLPGPDSKGIMGFIRSLMLTFGALSPSTLVIVLVLSILFQLTDILATFVLACAIGLNVPLLVFCAVIPLVYLALLMPISLGGLGVREGALAFLLSRFGVPVPEVVTLSFLIYLSRMVIGGCGGGLQLMETLLTRRPQSLVGNDVGYEVNKQ